MFIEIHYRSSPEELEFIIKRKKASLNFQKQCGRSGCSIFFSSDLKWPTVCSILGEVRVKGTEVVSRLYSLVLLGEGRGLVEAGGKRV